jgi:16S rRNA (uracil1498-N3)-methyltransferase
MLTFYHPELDPGQRPPYITRLGADESKHALKAMRLKPGDKVQLTDGKGYYYEGTILDTGRSSTGIEIDQCRQDFDFEAPRLHLAVSPLKNPDRLEWLVEKAVETGVYRLSLILCERTEKTHVNTERLKRIAAAALKQSLGSWLPLIDEPMRLPAFLEKYDGQEGFIAWCEGELPTLWKAYQPGRDCVILTGPEGDFSKDEAGLAINHGFRPVSLGSRRLRTETAGLVCCLGFRLLNENL